MAQPFHIRHCQHWYKPADGNQQRRSQGEEKPLPINENKQYQGPDFRAYTARVKQNSPPRQLQSSAAISQTAVLRYFCATTNKFSSQAGPRQRYSHEVPEKTAAMPRHMVWHSSAHGIGCNCSLFPKISIKIQVIASIRSEATQAANIKSEATQCSERREKPRKCSLLHGVHTMKSETRNEHRNKSTPPLL